MTERLRGFNPEEQNEPRDIWTPSQEVVISRETEGVLGRLTEIRDEGRNAGEFVVDSLLTVKKKGVIMGEPGIGKSTLLLQINYALERNAKLRGMELDIHITGYEDFLHRKEEEIGPRERWGLKDWADLNEEIFESVEQLGADKHSEDSRRRVDLIELPAVGKTNFRDRGVTASRMLFNTANERNDTLFMFITCNPLLQLRTSLLRAEIGKLTNNSRVIDRLAKHNIIVRNYRDKVEAGKRIKELMSRMANDDHMRTIRSEEQDKISNWDSSISSEMLNSELAENPNASRDARKYDLLIKRQGSMVKPPSVNLGEIEKIYREFSFDTSNPFLIQRLNNAEKQTLDQAVYIEEIMRNNYGLDKNTALIVHNFYHQQPIVFDLADFERPAA